MHEPLTMMMMHAKKDMVLERKDNRKDKKNHRQKQEQQG